MTWLVTPRVRAWALERGIVDKPGGRRVHAQPVPRLGGLSVIAGFLVPITLIALARTGIMHDFLAQPELLIGLVAGGSLVAIVGAIDDIRGLSPWTKLAAQAAAGGIAYAFGYRIDAVSVPFLGELSMGLASPFVTVLWFLAITNAINLIDGLDGLASGIALFASASNFGLAVLNSSPVVMLLSASLSGALLGFLRYNWNPATIFLGDAGSMFIGFVLAAMSIAGATTKSSTAIAIVAPIVALGVPITDTLLAMVRRTVARQSIFAADRGHIHHRLLDSGLTQRRVVLLLYVSSIVLAAAAIGVSFGRSWQSGAALVLAGAVVIALVRLVTRSAPPALEPEARPSSPSRPALRIATGRSPVNTVNKSAASDVAPPAYVARRAPD
ncbi:MAG: MraY family glycosyltransferase [Polyangiales bacterium]